MVINFKSFLVLFLFFLSNIAFAENGCPDGMIPFQDGGDAVAKCYPIQGGQNTTPAQPRGHWETRWGSIAVDFTKGKMGAVENMTSKRKAERAAIAKCHANGGGEGCKNAPLNYYNQCGAMAWGSSYASTFSAETKELASQKALAICSACSTDCQIYYAGCSLPVWIQ